SANHLPYGLLQPLPIPEGRWQSISMDFIGPLRPPTPRSHDAILVVVDRFTKRARFVPCRYAVSAREVADIVFDRVVRDHGLPLSIISDRDPHFTSRFWRRLHEVYGTQRRFSSSYHPQTDGQTEITNRTLVDILRKIVRDDQQWDLHLAHAEIAYNHAVSPATGMSPYYCDLGYHPRVPADFLRPSQMHPDTSCSALDDWVAHMTSIMKTAHEHIVASQTRMAARANRSRMDHPFKVGDDVLIDACHLQLEADTLRKFRRRFFGPCRILRAVGSDTASSPVSFRVKLPDYLRQARVHDVYHGAAQWLSFLQMSHDLLQQKVDEMRLVDDGGNALPYLTGTHQSMMQSLVHIITKLDERPASYLARFIDQQQAATLMRQCYTVFEEGQALCAVSMEHWYAQLDLEEEDDPPSSPATPTQVAGCPCIGINRNNNNNNNNNSNNNINNNNNNGNIVAAAASPFHGDSGDNGNIIAAAAGPFDGDSGEIGGIISHDNTTNNNTGSVVVGAISRSCADKKRQQQQQQQQQLQYR
ncbi:hypothetical protein CBR_g56841, partial [Chara braunii]